MVKLRIADESDAAELLEIYAPYVLNTAITFEYEVPSLAEFQKRIRSTLLKYPYILAEEDGKIIGYAYAGAFKGRAAYDWAVETTVYVRSDMKRRGIGRALYAELERLLKQQNILNTNACIAYTEHEDEYLTNDSVRFHTYSGYKHVGKFHKCGYKFGRWYDMVWMEKHLGKHINSPEKVIPFSEISRLT